ncbi:sugar ABC transporter [candidate division KSB3 bacterium]|uniref:Sugar ABC transporter n=1 Tax=candidate division KSB3 bacterium TaxID=2044937 RepID=A0A2G6KME8_9BACT|nr:MAG: sugar ABC transporter [candidate division KSB3 bacterium]
MKAKRMMYSLVNEAGIGVALVLICIFFAITTPKFASYLNFANILTQISINTVISVGMTFVILLGGIDLSVGSVLALATIVAGKTLTYEAFPVWLAILLAVIVSMIASSLCGLFNGFIAEHWKIHSFIVTLGMLNIARGAALQVSDSRTIFMFPDAFNNFGTVTVLGVPVIFIMALILVISGSFVLRKSVFGRMIYAIGNNEEAVRLSGHNTAFYKIAAFVICGAMVGIAAIMYMLRLNIASPILGVGFELNAIAAVVIGGTSMSGGKGSLTGTFLGACIMGVLNNGLLLIGMGDFARQMVTGFIIVAAVVVDTYRAKFSVKFQYS